MPYSNDVPDVFNIICIGFHCHCQHRLIGIVVKASASRAEDPGFESCLAWVFFWVESYQRLRNWHSSGYPARCPVLKSQCLDWLAQCQYTVTG